MSFAASRMLGTIAIVLVVLVVTTPVRAASETFVIAVQGHGDVRLVDVRPDLTLTLIGKLPEKPVYRGAREGNRLYVLTGTLPSRPNEHWHPRDQEIVRYELTAGAGAVARDRVHLRLETVNAATARNGVPVPRAACRRRCRFRRGSCEGPPSRYRWKAFSERTATHAAGSPMQNSVVTISCHAYTHVDAPIHFLPDGRDIASMPVDQWIGDAAVVDLTHLGPNGEVTAKDLDDRAQHVRRGDIALLRTDWPRKMDVTDPRFWHEGPWTAPTGCQWLIDRGAKAVGYDYPPDHCIRDTMATPRRVPRKDEYTTHALFFPAGITVIEYVTNLDQIGAARCRFSALPLKIADADGSPVRAIALLE